MRGSRHHLAQVPGPLGIIPAGAGLTSWPAARTCRKRDHPRGCGAHNLRAHNRYRQLGSSPRVRGSHYCFRNSKQAHGIIPAGAGLTHPDVQGGHCRRDHPRGCGAHMIFRMHSSTRSGSSPRVRGSQFLGKVLCVRIGIIPAGAGLTCAGKWSDVFERDHPRGCGAHRRKIRPEHRRGGSSPRVRGSRSSDSTCPYRPRIIPAGAGLTDAVFRSPHPAWDHPRGCGAHAQQLALHLEVVGIIPAGAGLTLRTASASR